MYVLGFYSAHHECAQLWSDSEIQMAIYCLIKVHGGISASFIDSHSPKLLIPVAFVNHSWFYEIQKSAFDVSRLCLHFDR